MPALGLVHWLAKLKNSFHPATNPYGDLMNIPASMTPETATWLCLQMTMASARATEPLRKEIDKVDEWANGLFTVLVQVLPGLLKANHPLAHQLEPQWRRASERFEHLSAGGSPIDSDETLERLEAPKMLYRLLEIMSVWDECRRHAPPAPPRQASRRARKAPRVG